MSNKLLSPFLVFLIAATIVLLALFAGNRLINGDESLLRNVVVAETVITPNADGANDATPITYELSRNATVSIYFEDDGGGRFYFRQEKARGAGEYEVLFSGVVDGFRLPNESVEGDIVHRLLRDGDYTWTIEATDFDGVTETQQGTITIAQADPDLPEIRNFTFDRYIFTPNRDGIDDRVLMQFFLPKEVAELRVYVQLPDGREVPIAEQARETAPNMPGRHYYDYEGGVDQGETPPPDGTYTIVAEAVDLEGQRVRATNELTIQFGGVPRADILSPSTGDTVEWSATAVALCDTIYFTMTVQNYSTTPIRTTGPAPGAVYDSDWNYNTLGWFTESGAWRAAIGYENELTNYPFRWALGDDSVLQEIDGYKYLMPGDRAVITGGIRVVDVFGNRNPQPLWAALIHEDVQISEGNNRVDPQAILIDVPDPAHRQECEPREVPVRLVEPQTN